MHPENVLQSNIGDRNQMTSQVQYIRAIGLTVADIERSKDFYIHALGFEAISDITIEDQAHSDLEDIDQARIRIATLQLGDERIELMQYLNCESKPIPSDSRSTDLWFQHFAIVVSDIDRAYTHLRSFPIEVTSTAPQTMPPDNPVAAGVRAFKFKDLDRHNLELIWFPPDKRQAKWNPSDDRLFLGIDHSAIAVANTEQSLQFYRDLLGMQIESSSLHTGETQALLDGLPEATVQVTGLRPAQGGVGIELLNYLAPANGRPIPQAWKSCDIPHLQVELVVNHIEQTLEELRQNGVQFVSQRLVSFAENSPYIQGCLVRDPNGHAMLLVTL
jgi:catechol 2,3-dioxygenase-like lactoylglutathione lyase family enzyme